MNAQKLFYVLCGSLAVLIISGGVGYYFASQTLRDGTSQLSQRLAEDRLADQKLSQLQDLEKQYQRLQPTLPAIMTALPEQKNQSQIALQLRSIAAASGMQLDGLTFSSSTAPGPTSQTVKVGDVLAVPVTFRLNGTYPELQQFLQRQEQLDRYTTVTSLGINQEVTSGLSFDISLNVFLKP